MPSLRCWDSESLLCVSVQRQDSSRSPETYLSQGTVYSLDVLFTACVSKIHTPSPTGLLTHLLLSPTTCHCHAGDLL